MHPVNASLSETKPDNSNAALNHNHAVQMNAFSFAADEGPLYAAPPPMEVKSPGSGRYRPQSSNQSPQSSTQYQPLNQSPQSIPDLGFGSACADVTVDDILSNVDRAEEVIYEEAFAMFRGGRTGVVGLDSATMRDFVCTNTCISMQDIDMELLKVASSDDGLSLNDFLRLLREFPISDGESIMQFMGMSADGETLVAEECRSALLLYMQQAFSVNFSEDQWERIFNTVMWDAGVTVPMEQWILYCKLTARILRLLRYVQIQKASGKGAPESRGRPVRGGA
jgi:hypothetical protein